MHNSLKILANEKKIELLPSFAGFSHSTPEILQHIEIMKHLKELPDSDLNLLNYKNSIHPRYSAATKYRIALEPAEIVFVELSSFKTFFHKGYYTQSNRISEYLDLPVETVEAALFNENYSKIPQGALAKLTEFTVSRQSPDMCRYDLDRILENLKDKKVILINHFLIEHENITKFKSRRRIRNICIEKSKEYSGFVTHFDPTPLLRRFGWPIVDYSHYQDSFKHVLALEFAQLIGRTIEHTESAVAM